MKRGNETPPALTCMLFSREGVVTTTHSAIVSEAGCERAAKMSGAAAFGTTRRKGGLLIHTLTTERGEASRFVSRWRKLRPKP